MQKNTRYAGFMPNDFIDGKGICVSLWTQGCPFHCKECHNPESWDPNGGFPVPDNLFERLDKAIYANGITRNFSILGGEPLAKTNEYSNRIFVSEALDHIKSLNDDNIKIFLWTGYTIEELLDELKNDEYLVNILNKVDYLIDGRFLINKRDTTLALRGSTNQVIYYLFNIREIDGDPTKWNLSTFFMSNNFDKVVSN